MFGNILVDRCLFFLFVNFNRSIVTALVFASSSQKYIADLADAAMTPSPFSNLPKKTFEINVPILYESETVLAINKPYGIPHHDDLDSGMPGILSLIRHLQMLDDNNANAIKYKGRIYGVHRLDKATSGILLLAKDKETASALSSYFRKKDIIKYYVGISTKKAKKAKQGWVKGDMIKGRRGSWLLQNTRNDPAITRFFTAGLGGLAKDLVDDICLPGGSIPRTVILFRPHTGRTHQLRVAAKSVGLPLMFDPYYADGTNVMRNEKCSELNSFSWSTVERTYLHATAIHLNLKDEEEITIWCPPPFGSLWKASIQDQFHNIVLKLIKKHGESPEITLAVMKNESA